MTNLACYSMHSHLLLYHSVPFFIDGVEIGGTLTIVILLDSALALQVDDIYILRLYAILSVYAKMFKVAIIIIEVNYWFILAPRWACRMTWASNKYNTTHHHWTTIHKSPHMFPLLNWSQRVNGKGMPWWCWGGRVFPMRECFGSLSLPFQCRGWQHILVPVCDLALEGALRIFAEDWF